MTQMVHVPSDYAASAARGADGTEGSREVTLLSAASTSEAELDAACAQAARGYVETVERITGGLVRGVDQGEGRVGVKVLGVGPTMLRFGALERHAEGEYALPVVGGLLAKRAGGQLAFRWRREGVGERFETAVEGFHPTLVGPGGTRLGRLFYALTQQVAHRWVMRRFHEEVRRERPRLLGHEG
jgi:hypothetical protein